MTDNDKKVKGQITTNENEEVVRVTWDIYKKYFKYVGGARQILITNFVMTCFICCKVYCDYLVGAWANLPDDQQQPDPTQKTQQSQFWWYCGMITLFAVLSSLGVMFRVLSLTSYSWHGHKRLHEDMLSRVF